ncbi:MAG TPA: methylenetetrahydrofolate reductase [Acidimicrobiia bacterium]|nr:methylenetetrahydrofolate reductase [Acidimicrobiia bacterium]
MKIADILAGGRTYSFEFFPPKTEAAEAQLAQALDELEPLAPSYVSVTYGAGGSTRARTHDLVVGIKARGTMEPMAHLTCAAHRRSQLVEIVSRYRDAGIDNILALGGDPPKDMADLPPTELEYATDLVALVREIGDFSVGVAIHPEGHPSSTDQRTDLARQAEKLAVADFGISQFFFEADIWSRFVADMRDRGVTTPLLAGIMPVTNVRSVKRMAAMSGADFPAWLEDRLRAVEDDEGAMHRVGVDAATELCRDLLDNGVDGLHFYTLNRSPATREIYDQLGLGSVSA